MLIPETAEACIDDGSTILVAPSARHADDAVKDFFGSVITPEELASGSLDLAGKTVYLYGDGSGTGNPRLAAAARVFVIRELSRVPLRVHGVGVYYRRFFDLTPITSARIRAEHAFQSLTESTKPGTAHRTGIYLTPVTPDGDELHFRLLRCSTNLSGPTENFRATDTAHRRGPEPGGRALSSETTRR